MSHDYFIKNIRTIKDKQSLLIPFTNLSTTILQQTRVCLFYSSFHFKRQNFLRFEKYYSSYFVHHLTFEINSSINMDQVERQVTSFNVNTKKLGCKSYFMFWLLFFCIFSIWLAMINDERWVRKHSLVLFDVFYFI